MRGHFQICVHFPISGSRSSRRFAGRARSHVLSGVSSAGLPVLPKAFDCSLLSRRRGCARSGHTPRSAVHFLALRRLEDPWDRRSPDRLRSTQPPSGREHLDAFPCAIGGASSHMTFIPKRGSPVHPGSCLRPNDTHPCQELATGVRSIPAAQPGMQRRRQ
jgi:hypothetical protein